MLTIRRALVMALKRAGADVIELEAIADGESAPRAAVAYPALTGPVAPGDIVHLNTTATGLRLGTGGVDFVIFNETTAGTSAIHGEPDGTEHIVKLRYTPFQHAVRAVEMEPEFAGFANLEDPLGGTPVVVCELHSQMACVAAGVKANRPEARVAYLMTGGAALPIGFSRLVRQLKDSGLIDATLTAGQAFGGDYECVTEASAMIAARHVAKADVIVVAQGPGNAGTGTRWGFSGLEQGTLLDLASVLGGAAFGVLRLSFADSRGRHYGLSHHTVTALGHVAQRPATAVFPFLPPGVEQADWENLRSEVLQSLVSRRHSIVDGDGAPGIALLAEKGVHATSMGRPVEADPIFFYAASAAGAYVAESFTL